MATSEDFRKVIDEMWDLHVVKGKDYGAKDDQFANVRSGVDWGVPPWVSSLIRAGDKIKRLQKYHRHGDLANESARDSLIDLCVYSAIALVLYDEQVRQEKIAEDKRLEPYGLVVRDA